MNFMKNLQHKFSRYGVPNLMLYVAGAQLVVYLSAMMFSNTIYYAFMFDRTAILSGQIWRVLTFITVPQSANPFSLLISLYFMYFIGQALEQYWGSGYLTFFYVCNVLAAIITGFITGWTTAGYITLALFLAFAQLYPEMEILFMFFIPVKVKYMGYVSWALLGLNLLVGTWADKAAILAVVAVFLLFFGQDFIGWIKNQRRYGAQRRNFRRSMNNGQNNNWYR